MRPKNQIRIIKPIREGLVSSSKKPLLWKLYSKHRKFVLEMKENAATHAAAATPPIHLLASHLAKPEKFDLTNFDHITFEEERQIHLPTKILRDLAELNNLKCEVGNIDEYWKIDWRYTKKIMKISTKIAKQLYIFIWNIFYWKHLEKGLSATNELSYRRGEGEQYVFGGLEELYDRLSYLYFKGTDNLIWRH